MAREQNTHALLLHYLNILYGKPPYPVSFWRGDFWRWTTKTYAKISEKDFGSILMGAMLQDKRAIDPTQIKRLIEVAKMDNTISIPDHEDMPVLTDATDTDLYRAQPNYFAFSNGILDLGAWNQGVFKIVPHTPRWFSDQVVDYPFKPKAGCPKWESILAELLPDLETRELLQMWFGYCLTTGTSHQKFLLAYGPAGTGKSVMATALRFVLGPLACSAVPLKLFGSDFSLYSTVSKRVNIDPDMSDIEKVDEGRLKSYVGGDVIHVNRKYKDPLEVLPTAKLVFCTNDLPHISDKSDATWRRLILLPFDTVISPERRILSLIANKPKDWYLRDELPGIWNWAFRGLQLLQARGSFPEPQVVLDATNEYKTDNSAVRQWLDECCTLGGNHDISCSAAYTEFRAWASDKGFMIPATTTFGKALRNATGRSVSKHQRKIAGQNHKFYRGLKVAPR